MTKLTLVGGVTDVSSCAHPEQLLGLSGGAPVQVRRVHWLHLDWDLVGQQLVETLSRLLCQVWFAAMRKKNRRVSKAVEVLPEGAAASGT